MRLFRPALIAFAGILLFAASYAAKERYLENTGRITARQPGYANRIVTLAPGITETAYALGLGNKIVADTRYCDYPPEAKEKPKVGGYLDINYEAIALQKPDIVFSMQEHNNDMLGRMGFRVIPLNNKNIADIVSAINLMGNATGANDRARELTGKIRASVKNIADKTAGAASKPRVLLLIGRLGMDKGITSLNIASKKSYYDELIRIAGGTNAYDGGFGEYPSVSAEGLHVIDPDMIIEIVPDASADEAALILDWWKTDMQGLRAVTTGNIKIVTDQSAVRPGPRVTSLLMILAQSIHPEIFTR